MVKTKIGNMGFILISEAVKRTGLERQTIRNWIDNGIIPAKKINGTFYVDSDTFDRLSDGLMDVEQARLNMEHQKSLYHEEAEEYRRRRDAVHDDHMRDRTISLCANKGVRTGFFGSVLQLMNVCGILDYTDKEILSEAIKGTDLNDIAVSFGLTRERIRQKVEKALHRSADITAIADAISCMGEKDQRIRELEEENTIIRRMLYKDAIFATEAVLNEDEKKLARMDKQELIGILSRRLTDENLSVRALNCLYGYHGKQGHHPIKTIGELCRITETEYLSQRNAGKKTLAELTALLNSYGLAWGLDIEKILKL